MKKQHYKHLFLGLSAGFFLSTSAFAGFEFTAPVAPPQPQAMPTPQGGDALLPVIVEEGDMLPPIVREPIQTAPLPMSPAPMAAPLPTANSGQYDMAVGFGNDLPMVSALRQIIPADYTYSLNTGVDGGQNVSWNGGKAWPVALNDMLAPLDLTSTIEGKMVLIHQKGQIQPMNDIVRPSSQPAPMAMQSTQNQAAPIVAPEPVLADQSKQGTYVNPAQSETTMEAPLDTMSAMRNPTPSESAIIDEQPAAPPVAAAPQQPSSSNIKWESEPVKGNEFTRREEGPKLTSAYDQPAAEATTMTVVESDTIISEETNTEPTAQAIRLEDIQFEEVAKSPSAPIRTNMASEERIEVATVTASTRVENTEAIKEEQIEVPTLTAPTSVENIETEEMVLLETSATATQAVPAITSQGTVAKSEARGRRSNPVLEDDTNVPLLKRDQVAALSSMRLQPNQASYDVMSGGKKAPVSPTPALFTTPAPMTQPEMKTTPVASVSEKVSSSTALEETQTPTISTQTASDMPKASTMKWKAQSGTSLQDVLTEWSNREGAELVWSSEYDYILSNDVNADGNYAEAVQTLLEGFANETPAPAATLHPNLPEGPAVLVIEASNG